MLQSKYTNQTAIFYCH